MFWPFPSTLSISQSHLTPDDQGPIIRITPTEIHIADTDFDDIIYSQAQVNKAEVVRYRLGSPGSIYTTVEKDLHQKRRATLTTYISPDVEISTSRRAFKSGSTSYGRRALKGIALDNGTIED